MELKIKTDGKEYVSKPFDFKAMCLVNEKHNDEAVKGPLMICRDAVEYLFEGTGADLDKISPGKAAKLCMSVWSQYIKELTSKND